MDLKPDCTRAEFPHLTAIQTRWMDNDIYGHVNNALYYAFFDTAINRFLIEQGGLDIAVGPIIGVAGESYCRFRQSFSFPEIVEVGLRVAKLGNASVRYELAIFKQGEPESAAIGYFIHVFVDRQTRKSVRIPPSIRAALERLVVQG